jgi:FAD/FMN-containing dehydrogenase/Fe-S oxidoreductase
MFNLEELKECFSGDIQTDYVSRTIYATDASEYKETPTGVVRPKNQDDIIQFVKWAAKYKQSIIPRAAGTSIAGQVVGNGWILDCSRYMTNILEINLEEKWVRVEPGVIRDELNLVLSPKGYFFSPETSTSNRCMLGGMVGNNACGAHSLIYGSTRDHLLEAKVVLSDGSVTLFKDLNSEEYLNKLKEYTFANTIYQKINEILIESSNRSEIEKEYPEKGLNRRNTGYALDLLAQTDPFVGNGIPFNLCKILAGSEGTLGIITELKLALTPNPLPVKGVVCAHFHSVDEALQANLIALKYAPGAIELIDKIILDCTKQNIEQSRNRFFIHDDPGAILVVEWDRSTTDEIQKLASDMELEMRSLGLGFHFPLILGADINKVWSVRKAGLGLLSNIPGDAKPVSLVEDTAVLPQYLPAYIAEFRQLLDKHKLTSVYHAHAATGELHLRPVLNLKTPEGVLLFREIATETAKLVKKYRGSLSGEHGDGRLRGEFIPFMIGEHNYNLLRQIKQAFDPHGIFNPGKIVDTPPMDKYFRFTNVSNSNKYTTTFDFSKTGGILPQIEKCNGSGDCRKTEKMGGTMCPSYMASREEKNTPRARANFLRETFFKYPQNPFNQNDVVEMLDLCLSCKACKAECPSGIDIAKLKAEYMQHYYQQNGVPLRTWLISRINWIYKLSALSPKIANAFYSKSFFHYLKSGFGIAKERSFPKISDFTLKKHLKKHLIELNNLLPANAPTVCLFVDEFTNYTDAELGKHCLLLLNKLGYRITYLPFIESGRAYISKGLVNKAQKIAKKNIAIASQLPAGVPLIGLEPSAILSFRDEYPDLVGERLKELAQSIANKTFMVEEFLAEEINKNHISVKKFTNKPAQIWLHGHCQQKAIATTQASKTILSFPTNYKVSEIPSGCCGMAGSFGFEKEHFNLSMKIGELVLFPAIRNISEQDIIAAPGTSCRHQILDGTHRVALHPIEILFQALNVE